MLPGDERRNKILEMLNKQAEPISGSALAKQFGVSRQVIVQDIALIRAYNKEVLATNKGYVLYTQTTDGRKHRSLCVKHNKSQIADELNTIVDFGGQVLDVVVDHKIYGQITVDLIINNRQDVIDFVDKVEAYKSMPLKELTAGIHFHTITAATEEVLDTIEAALDKRGYLYKL